MRYSVLKKKHSDEFNKFPMIFAFDSKQLEEGIKKLDVSSKEELVSIGAGGFIRKTDKEKYLKMCKSHTEEIKEYIANDNDFVYSMFISIMNDYEYCISGDIEDVFNACGLDVSVYNNDSRIRGIFEKAEKKYLESIE